MSEGGTGENAAASQGEDSSRQFVHEDEKSKTNSQGGDKETSRSSSVTSSRSQDKKGMDEIDPDENAQDNKVGDWRNMRRIIAEDPEWSLATVPLLNELVVKHVVDNFESKILYHILLITIFIIFIPILKAVKREFIKNNHNQNKAISMMRGKSLRFDVEM